MTSMDVLEDVVEEYEEFILGEHVIHRDMTQALENSLTMEEIDVIIGVRRSGKTYLTFELLQDQGGVYLNFEDERLIDFSPMDFEKVRDIADERGTRNIVFDEVQEVQGWEKFAHRAHRKYKIIVTGSNSGLLSSDYSKALTGRTRTHRISPLSYPEFLRFRRGRIGRRTLVEYLDLGGFPRIALSGDIALANEYLDRIIYRDIVTRVRVDHIDALHQIAIYLLSNVGKEYSYRSLMKVSGLKNAGTVRNYVSLLEDAFLIETLYRYSPSLKVQSGYSKKVYAVDVALARLGKRVLDDRGRLLENAVYLHLKRNADIYYLKNQREADFVACEGLKPERIVNVSFDVRDDDTFEREISSLRYFGEKYDIPMELVTLYQRDVPQDIGDRLAHRYLSSMKDD